MTFAILIYADGAFVSLLSLMVTVMAPKQTWTQFPHFTKHWDAFWVDLVGALFTVVHRCYSVDTGCIKATLTEIGVWFKNSLFSEDVIKAALVSVTLRNEN